MTRRLETLSGEEWKRLSREHTIFILQVSGLEDHGPHLSLNLDTRESSEITRKVMERMEAQNDPWITLELPPLTAMVSGNQGNTYKLEVRGHVVRDYLVDTCFSLWKNGFKYFVIFSGTLTPKHLTTIEEAGEILKRRARNTLPWRQRIGHRHLLPVFVSASSALVDSKKVWASPLWPDLTEHGGERDTSIALALDPSESIEKTRNLIPQPAPDTFWGRTQLRMRGQTPSYWGNPAHAARETGERLLRDQVERIAVPLVQVLKGQARPEDFFKSGYGIFPSNRSLFTVWVLSLALVAILTLWILLNLHWMTEMSGGGSS